MTSNIFYYIKVTLLPLFTRGAQARLKIKKQAQFQAFNSLKARFAQRYKILKNSDRPSLILLLWRNYNKDLENLFFPSPPFNFLRIPAVLRTMFVTAGGRWQQEELKFLEGKLKKRELRRLLEEDLVGGPILLNSKYLTSHNSIHQLYHLARFLSATDCNLRKVKVVVEWGGGYGNMAKIFTRLKKQPTTYILIDTALFCCIQWLYLSTILGKEKVNLIQNLQGKVKKGKINILPVGYVQKYKIQTDLFISTWALSESSRFSQDVVIRRRWFGAKRLLLGYQRGSLNFPYADRIHNMMIKYRSKIEPIDFLPGNFYAFR